MPDEPDPPPNAAPGLATVLAPYRKWVAIVGVIAILAIVGVRVVGSPTRDGPTASTVFPPWSIVSNQGSTAGPPTIRVTPAGPLREGQTVRVELTGFRVGDRIRLFECASAGAASTDCGAQLAIGPFLDVDYGSGGGVISMVVTASVAFGPGQNAERVPCADQCVMVATAAGVEGVSPSILVSTPLRFAT